MDDGEARDRVARVENLLEEIETLADPAGRETATETVEALLELYGEGLARIVGHLAEKGDAEELTEDELVSHLLLVHGLHPVPVEERVLAALQEVRPYLESHGGNVDLLGVEDGVARLRMEGSCDGCPSSAMTLKLAIEEAIQKAAPDVETVEAEGATEPPGPQLLQLNVSDSLAQAGGTESPAGGTESGTASPWAMAGGLPELAGGGAVRKEVSGEPVLFVKLEETFYAYRPSCPGCEASLDGTALGRDEVVCPECGNRYDVRRAGRCLDAPDRYLTPIPLLLDDAGLTRVAVGSPVS